MNTPQPPQPEQAIELTAGTEIYITIAGKNNIRTIGLFAGFTQLANVPYIILQKSDLENQIQMMIPMHTISILEIVTPKHKLINL